MIPNVTPGEDAVGLATYLVGEGRANEHENPHLVAGSPHITAWYDDQELSHEDAVELGREINQAHRVYGTQVEGGHVRHISLSLHKQDRELPDDKWTQIAEDFMRDMGYIDVEGKADVRWAAVRHGLSGKNENDHIHLMVSVVRDDGTKASTYLDYQRSQTVARGLEDKHGLFKVGRILSARGYTPREVAAASARGRTETERDTLERVVRACSTASTTEDEFVRRLRGEGLRVAASYDKDGAQRGYKVALQPPADKRAIYYGGGKIARDLSLGSLRQRWPQDPANQEKASAEWTAATRGLRIVQGGREQSDPHFSSGELATHLSQWRDRLMKMDPADHEGWRAAAGELSGVFAAWSRATEDTPGPLADVAKELGRSAQMRRAVHTPREHNPAAGATAAMAMTFAASRGGPMAKLAWFRQLSALAGAMHAHQQAAGDKVRQNGLEKVAYDRLSNLNETFHELAGVPLPVEKAPTRSKTAASVMPEKMTKHHTEDRADVRGR